MHLIAFYFLAMLFLRTIEGISIALQITIAVIGIMLVLWMLNWGKSNKVDPKIDKENERRRLNRLGIESVYGDSTSDNTILDKNTQKYVDYVPTKKTN